MEKIDVFSNKLETRGSGQCVAFCSDMSSFNLICCTMLFR